MNQWQRMKKLIERLPEDELTVAEVFLIFLSEGRKDPSLLADAIAPWDDEPTTPEEDEGAEEARQEHLRGEARPWEEVRQELVGQLSRAWPFVR